MKSSWLAAGVVIVVLCLWMASGLLSSTKSDDADEPVATQPMTVEVTEVSLEDKSREVILQGQLEPRRRVYVRAETQGTLATLSVEKGARVTAGTRLAQLDPGLRQSRLADARAQLRSATSEQTAARSLRRQGLQSQVQLEAAEARLESTRAALASIEREIANTSIRAPFDGVINDLPLDPGTLVERGDAIAELVDDSSFEVTGQAAQMILSQLTVGQTVEVRLITGAALPGRLSFIASVADPATRSFRVEATATNPGGIASGISASIVIPVETVKAAFISPSAFSLGDAGELGVKTVDTDSVVSFMPIELVSSSLSGAWVTGLTDGDRVITLGQGFVTAGEQVTAQMAGARN